MSTEINLSEPETCDLDKITVDYLSLFHEPNSMSSILEDSSKRLQMDFAKIHTQRLKENINNNAKLLKSTHKNLSRDIASYNTKADDQLNYQEIMYERGLNTVVSGDIYVLNDDTVNNAMVIPENILSSKFNKHLAHMLDKSKFELADKVMEIGEGQFQVEDIEKKIESIIDLLKA